MLVIRLLKTSILGVSPSHCQVTGPEFDSKLSKVHSTFNLFCVNKISIKFAWELCILLPRSDHYLTIEYAVKHPKVHGKTKQRKKKSMPR